MLDPKTTTPKLAALLVYIKWAKIERTEVYAHPYSNLCVDLSKFEADCPWCSLYHEAFMYCPGCPLDEEEQNCFASKSWYYLGSHGNKVAAGNIARVAWQEYKRLGG